MKRARLPVGVDSFRELITNRDPAGNHYLFVDKSLFIRDFFNNDAKVALITRPRRFGKTLTLSMLYNFLMPKTMGEPTKGLFKGLAIEEEKPIMAEQGQHPAIFLTLKEVKGSTFEEAYSQMRNVIIRLFDSHRNLLQSANTSDIQKSLYRDITEKRGEMADYASALHLLTQLLYQHTGKRVSLLIDEYDSPIHDAYLQGYYDQWIGFVRPLFGSAMKGNDYLNKALITGILRVGKESLFSGLNNVTTYSVLDRRFASYFGFTAEEVDDLLQQTHLPKSVTALKELYNGYQIGGYTLYNPFSIVAFLSGAVGLEKESIQEALKPYWINTSSHELIRAVLKRNLADLQPQLTQLVNNEPIIATIEEQIVFGHLAESPDTFWSLLLLAGYLKIVEKKFVRHRYECKLLFPNEEIRQSMENLLLSTLSKGRVQLYRNWIYEALSQGDTERFEAGLNNYLLESISYFDGGSNKPELFYHGLVLGLAICFSPTHYVRSNRESGAGRYDIALLPREKEGMGILLELKCVGKAEELAQAARLAFEQIEKKEYTKELEGKGASPILKLGIAFYKKKAAVYPSTTRL